MCSFRHTHFCWTLFRQKCWKNDAENLFFLNKSRQISPVWENAKKRVIPNWKNTFHVHEFCDRRFSLRPGQHWSTILGFAANAVKIVASYFSWLSLHARIFYANKFSPMGIYFTNSRTWNFSRKKFWENIRTRLIQLRLAQFFCSV